MLFSYSLFWTAPCCLRATLLQNRLTAAQSHGWLPPYQACSLWGEDTGARLSDTGTNFVMLRAVAPQGLAQPGG